MTRRTPARAAVAAATLTALSLTGGCGAQLASTAVDGRLRVVATTPVLADLARQVAGNTAEVTALVPPGADPHTYEPSLRNVRSVAYADVAFSNYLMLEPHALIKALDANLRPGVPNVSLAEASTKHGAEVIPLVENAALDTLWLGLRVRGTGDTRGATRASDVELSVTGVDGPGHLFAYITETFGRPRVFSSSADGFQPTDGFRHDTITLPTDAHTHMSWAFTEPGVYRMRVKATLRTTPDAPPQHVGSGEALFVVGVDPSTVPEAQGRTPLALGHADLTADLDSGRLVLQVDPASGRGKGHAKPTTADLDETVLVVPPKALAEIPPMPEFRFLGKPGSQIHQLPQAVLGAHVHGEIDPHGWLSVNNAKAYVRTMAETLVQADPQHAASYRANETEALRRLTDLDRYVAGRIATIPQARRHLVTTHDAYGYLAADYGLEVAGFVTPNPGVEPSLAQRRKLAQTIRQLRVPAVFLEPALARRSSVLRTIAADTGVRICTIRADTFDGDVQSYDALMRANADSLAECLG